MTIEDTSHLHVHVVVLRPRRDPYPKAKVFVSPHDALDFCQSLPDTDMACTLRVTVPDASSADELGDTLYFSSPQTLDNIDSLWNHPENAAPYPQGLALVRPARVSASADTSGINPDEVGTPTFTGLPGVFATGLVVVEDKGLNGNVYHPSEWERLTQRFGVGVDRLLEVRHPALARRGFAIVDEERTAMLTPVLYRSHAEAVAVMEGLHDDTARVTVFTVNPEPVFLLTDPDGHEEPIVVLGPRQRAEGMARSRIHKKRAEHRQRLEQAHRACVEVGVQQDFEGWLAANGLRLEAEDYVITEVVAR